jgi:hypothetical protein
MSRDWRPVEAHHVDAAEFMDLMTMGGRWPALTISGLS